MKIYIDLFFLFNVIMDFMIILGTSIILKRNSNLIRIIISSLIGGVSSILLFDNINKILIEVISIIIMVLISFGYKGIKYVLRNIFYMYLLSTLIGGIIYLFNVKVSNNIVINYFIIIVISSLVLILYIKENRKIKNIYNNYYKVDIYFKDKSKISVVGFIDTGNNLYDPYRKRPIIVLDIKNDLDIKNIHQYYLKEKKIPEYKDKTKILNVCLIISIVVLIVWAIITIPNITKTENLSEIENTLVITTNKGNNIETQYEMFDGFKIKIPSEFKIMSDEIVNVKYPNGNAPSLVYTNDKTTINVALVMNDVTMKNSQIEEYVKTMESTYKNYSKDVKLNFWERNNHKIGEMKFTTQGSDTEIYNHIIAFSVNDKLRLVNFNCTKEQMSEWQEVSKFIVDSIMFE